MSQLWQLLLVQPILNALIALYQLFGDNLALAIIALTTLLRFILIPITAPSLRAARKMQELSPQIAKLKQKHGDDKEALAKAQLELYRQEGANPAAGCLPQIVQLVVLIALFNVFNQLLHSNGDITTINNLLYPSLKFPDGETIITTSFGLNLSSPNTIKLPFLPFPLPGLLVVLSAITQFFSSKMMLPASQAATSAAEKTPQKEDDMAAAMQTQMLYMFPLMTLIVGINFPAGLALYWLVFSVFSIIQQKFTFKNSK